jgi:hypothetical protein
MPRLTWHLAAGFDGLMIDTPAPEPASGRLVNKEAAGKPGATARAERKTDKVITQTNRSSAGYFKPPANIQGTGVGGLIDGLYVFNQVANKHAANSAETAALSALVPSVIAIMPRDHGGVLVVSAFGVSGPAVTFRSCYVHGPFRTMSLGIEAYHARGVIRPRDTTNRLWWVTTDRPKDAPHSGPPVMSPWR